MSVHSFISHSSQAIKRNCKCFIEIIALILLLILGETVLEYLLIDDVGSFERVLLHEFYQNSKNIDYLYLGPSHVYCDIKPSALDVINGRNNFNLGTSAQPLIASYYLLKEADKNHDLECVYVDLFFPYLLGNNANWREPDELRTSWYVMNQMKTSVNKLDWIFHSTSPRYVYLSLFPSIRNKDKILDFDYLAEQLRGKSQADYWNYNDCTAYVDKGYYYTESIAEEFYYTTTREEAGDSLKLSEDAKEYLIKIIEYCKENDIELTLFANPVSDWFICRTGGYDNYITQVKEIVSEYGLEYYDFNLCKEKYLDIGEHIYWRDDNHLNAYGAEIYTNFIGSFFQQLHCGKIENDEYFYDSYQQKLNAMDEQVFGVIIEEMDDERRTEYLVKLGLQTDLKDYRIFSLSAVDNLIDDKAEYYFYSIDLETGEKTDVQDWSENNVYAIPMDVEGKIGVKVRLKGTGRECGAAIVEY